MRSTCQLLSLLSLRPATEPACCHRDGDCRAVLPAAAVWPEPVLAPAELDGAELAAAGLMVAMRLPSSSSQSLTVKVAALPANACKTSGIL